MKEIWKDIKGYEGLYQVSKSGKIKSIRNNIYLKPNLQVNGYLRISLSKNGKIQYKNIHRLVAETFIDNENNYPVINHIDGNKKKFCQNAFKRIIGSKLRWKFR